MDSNSDDVVFVMAQNWQPSGKVSLYKVGVNQWRIEAQWPDWFNPAQGGVIPEDFIHCLLDDCSLCFKCIDYDVAVSIYYLLISRVFHYRAKINTGSSSDAHS